MLGMRGIAVRADQLAADHRTGTGQNRLTPDDILAVTSSGGTASCFAVADALAAGNPRGMMAALRAAQEAGTLAPIIISSCVMVLRDLAR
jgi:hypothetical protein